MKMNTETIILICSLVVLASAVIANIILFRRRKYMKNRQMIESVQKREMELNEKLQNPSAAASGVEKLRPYEERYLPDSNSSEAGTRKGGKKIELQVKTPLSDKKYITDVVDNLSIGTGAENSIILDSRQDIEIKCALVLTDGELIIRNLNPALQLTVRRGRSVRVFPQGVVTIRSQDRFYLGDVELGVRFV